MSGQVLIKMLKKIGYNDTGKLSPQSLGWAFDGDSETFPFIQWVCSIGKENLLSQREMELFGKLMEEGKVLNRSALEDALRVSSIDIDKYSNENEDEDLEALKFQEQQLQIKLKAILNRKMTLVKEKDMLDAEHIYLKNKLSSLDEVTAKVKRCYKTVLEVNDGHGHEMDEAVQKVSQGVGKLIDLYNPDMILNGNAVQVASDYNFISQMELSRYNQMEEKYSQDLAAFTKKRFFEGMADIAGGRETGQYNILDVSNPDLSTHDLDDDLVDDGFKEDCQEFALLQQIFPQSELNRINAVVDTRRAMNAVQEAKAVLHLLKREQFPSTEITISRLQRQTDESIRNLEYQCQSFQNSVPDLVKRLGDLQGNEILTGNYELKLKRQDYFTQNQDQIIDYLLDQRSRTELMVMFYDLELQFHERTHVLLSAISKRLKTIGYSWNHRMRCLEDSDLTQSMSEIGVVDSRDLTTQAIYQAMANSTTCPLNCEDSQLYLPVSKLKSRAESLQTQYEACDEDALSWQTEYSSNADQLDLSLSACFKSLYGGASTTEGMPNLRPDIVQTAMVTLQGHLDDLVFHLNKIMSDVKKKKKMLKSDPALNKEREVFTLFHTNPQRLISSIQDLEQIVKVTKA